MFLGDISFPGYLLQLQTLYLLQILFKAGILLDIVGILLTCVIAYIVHNYYEIYFIKVSKKLCLPESPLLQEESNNANNEDNTENNDANNKNT